ncbi:Fic family protein [Gordonia sp. ABSL11-1]|uniref:Fic family protein n=1 Tax=Gordonia sp. ABSL11-1 TaxID=3053924 RepID=UPI002573946B|nr:Fic family protein [Gordonia sp. ABSL11-1]MDL9946920.1 Fic family protein [Gordonia sp. ABSL11-1]
MGWPSCRVEERPWVSSGRAPSRADRLLRSIEVAIPPFIAGLPYEVTGTAARAHEAAVIAVARLEAGHGAHLAPLADFLLRTESIASSKIEHVDADLRSFGKALAGGRSSAEARAQLAAVHALITMVDAAGSEAISLSLLLRAHDTLMSVGRHEPDDVGRLREVQNWIGGSDYSPRNALFVPPPPDLVTTLMSDVIEFSNRTDLPILAQAAIAHAQFESIHPFVDGNGRIGRALISAILRRRGLTNRVTVPLASAMLADTGRYFAELGRYRSGDVDGFVEYVAVGTLHAVASAEESAQVLAGLPAEWRDRARPRANSADACLIDALLGTPVMDADTAQRITGTSDASTYRALSRLTNSGVLEMISTSKRNQVWAAPDVLGELDALSAAIGRRTLSG